MPNQVSLSPHGPTVSDVVYGTWRMLDDDPKPSVDSLVARFEMLLELGITTLDTAEIYGLYTVEAGIGEVFKAKPELRDQFQLITKCGIDVPSDTKSTARLPHYNSSTENIIECTKKALQLMNTDRIDLLLVHRPDWFTSADDTAAGHQKVVADGKVLHTGVSNYLPSQFDLLQSRMDGKLVTNQVEISLLEMATLFDGTLAQLEEQRIHPMAWSPLAGGRLFDPKNKAGVRIRTCMDEIRGRYDGASDDALAFAWVMNHPSQPLTIIGTNKEDRIRSQASAAAIKLERQDWYALWSAAKGTPIP